MAFSNGPIWSRESPPDPRLPRCRPHQPLRQPPPAAPAGPASADGLQRRRHERSQQGSLLHLQNSWLRARDDLALSNLVWSNRQQLEQAADPQRLRNEQQLREALCVLRQAGEASGSRSRHRGDPPPLDPSAP